MTKVKGNNHVSMLKRVFLIVALLGIMAFGLFLVGCDDGRKNPAPQGAPIEMTYAGGLHPFYVGQQENTVDWTKVKFNVRYSNTTVEKFANDQMITRSGFNTESATANDAPITLTFTYTDGNYNPVTAEVTVTVSEATPYSVDYTNWLNSTPPQMGTSQWTDREFYDAEHKKVRIVSQYTGKVNGTEESVTGSAEEVIVTRDQFDVKVYHKDSNVEVVPDEIGRVWFFDQEPGAYYLKIEYKGALAGEKSATKDFTLVNDIGYLSCYDVKNGATFSTNSQAMAAKGHTGTITVNQNGQIDLNKLWIEYTWNIFASEAEHAEYKKDPSAWNEAHDGHGPGVVYELVNCGQKYVDNYTYTLREVVETDGHGAEEEVETPEPATHTLTLNAQKTALGLSGINAGKYTLVIKNTALQYDSNSNAISYEIIILDPATLS